MMLSEEIREFKKDFYSVCIKIRWLDGLVGNSIKNATNAVNEYNGLDKKLKTAKYSINEGLEKIGLKKPIEKTGEIVGNVISKIGIVNKTVEKTNEDYNAVKEKTGKVIDKIKPKSDEEKKKEDE